VESVSSSTGRERKQRTKAAKPVPLGAAGGKGGEERNRNGPDACAPAPTAFKLLVYNLSVSFLSFFFFLLFLQGIKTPGH
jgi:hypothetical protein